MVRAFLPLLFQIVSFTALAQIVSFTALAQQDSAAGTPAREKLTVSSLAAPAVLTAYGFVALSSKPLQLLDRNVRQVVWFDHPHARFSLDNYLQYTPGAAVYILNAFGIKGRNNFRDRTIIYGMANVIMAVSVLSLKKAINAPRPDGSGNDGFPSGHTATAFAAAEFMRKEFSGRSPWYGVAGYSAAVITGFLRVYNDKHWASEVLTGAGLGIISTKVSYWLFPVVHTRFFQE
jgi:membrane-associated phospholipid phosphatase